MSQQMMQFEAFERGQQARQAQFQGFDNALVGVTPQQ
jgi:hypothetical protein